MLFSVGWDWRNRVCVWMFVWCGVVWITDAKIQKKYQFAKYQAFITHKNMLIFHMQHV